ncbi:MAG: hydrogenase formation protein HypD [Candidatus Thermoplasmatota archaeon]
MSTMDEHRIVERALAEIKGMGLRLKVMHVCGTHQDTLVRHGLQPLFESAGVTIVQGPGCPVCVTTPKEIEEARALALNGMRVLAFGDMMNVPGPSGSLYSAREEGADVRIVYSVSDALRSAREEPGVGHVFMGVGFETTAPSTAVALLSDPPENFSVLSCHRYVPPALRAILEMGEVKLDGLIEPGHVSTIIGLKPYIPISEQWKVPQVVAGFEPLDLVLGVLMLARQVAEARAEVENEYSRVVRFEGNPKALHALSTVFQPQDIEWRGFPSIPVSGMRLKPGFETHDARKLYEEILSPLEDAEFEEPEGCRCGEVLRGLIESEECPLFGTACAPEHPIGPCMVSAEGSCNILYRLKAHEKSVK